MNRGFSRAQVNESAGIRMSYHEMHLALSKYTKHTVPGFVG